MNAEGENSAPSCFRTTAVMEGVHLGSADPSDASRENDIERTNERETAETSRPNANGRPTHTAHTKAQQAVLLGRWLG